MMEFYEAYADYQALMRMTEELFAHAAMKAIGTTDIVYSDRQISLGAPFARVSLREAARDAASRRLPRDITEADLRARVRSAADRRRRRRHRPLRDAADQQPVDPRRDPVSVDEEAGLTWTFPSSSRSLSAI